MAPNTPYSRPTAPGGAKPTGPKIPAPPKGGGIWGPATRQQALKTPKPKAQTVSPYDQFTLNDPYAPGKINSLATSGYNTDTANAQKLAAMGYPTDSAVTADYAQRGATANGIQQALAAHLAGVQGVDVAQGNAGSAALGAQNVATQATAPHIAGAPAAPSLPTGAAQAVLGSQTAAAGNYDSALQAAALSSGATAEQNANNAGLVAQQGNQQSIQKTLASLLSGVPSVSSRESTMSTANQSTDAANKQTALTIWTGLQNRALTAQAEGDKVGLAAADLGLKQYEASLSAATKRALGISTNQTKVTVAGINSTTSRANNLNTTATSTANNKRTNATSTANSKRSAAAKRATAAGKTVKSYKVVYDAPVPGKDPITGLGGNDPKTGKPYPPTYKRMTKTVPAAVWDRFNKSGPVGKRKFAIIGVPEGSRFKSSTGY